MDKSSLHPLLEAEFAGHNGLVIGRLGEKPILSIRLARAPSSRPPVSEAGAHFAKGFCMAPAPRLRDPFQSTRGNSKEKSVMFGAGGGT